MRRLIRLTVVVAMLATIAVFAPPASADHDEPDGTNWPADPATGKQGDHEEKPNVAVARPDDVCVVDGQLNAAAFPTVGGPPHALGLPGQENPAHSHYDFVGVNTIECLSKGVLSVTSKAGNDGHAFDVDGGNVEADPLTNDAAQHPFNDHHGSVSESAWSNSSLYAGPGGPRAGMAPVPGGWLEGASNACDDSGRNANKGTLTAVNANGAVSDAWIKYVRAGVVAYVWGCFYGSADKLGGQVFSGAVAVTPSDPVLFATSPTTPQPFNIDGAAVLGACWLVDTQTASDPVPGNATDNDGPHTCP